MKPLRFIAVILLLFVARAQAQVPLYNSYPSATAVLFLDFDGQIINGTNWNMDGPLYCGPSNLNTAQIIEVFERVAEDFRPFNLNVTTDSTVYEAAPVDQRMRVVLTITSNWYGVAGGVAYTNSFSWGNNTPCFVFTALHKYNVKNIAEAASHEAGHTLGLRHQAVYDSTCVKVSDYNDGLGSGLAGWAPIMGMGYYRNATTWHNGPNPYGCTNAQDDLAIITGERNGFGYRPDDNKATDFAAAVPLQAARNELVANGLISTNTDTDLFSFTMPSGGHIALNVRPYSLANNDIGANLDVEVQLYNTKRQLLNTYNPADKMSVAIDTTLASGDYYMVVSGASNPFASNYASLGAYAINGTVSKAMPLALRVLQLRSTANATVQQLNWTIDADRTVTKQVLEGSVSGSAFRPIAHLLPEARTYPVTPAEATQYRLSITFEDGGQYQSNSITLQSRNTPLKPHLYTNIIHSNMLQVASPERYGFTITDAAGLLLKQGTITAGANTIHMGFLKSGVYAILFQNGAERFVEKFIRQ
jgi:hypothetical protein